MPSFRPVDQTAMDIPQQPGAVANHPALQQQIAQQAERAAKMQADAEAAHKVAMQAVMLGIATLSKRALIAIASLTTLLTVASVFWLFMSLPEPNAYQLVSMGLYAGFVLLINLLVVWRK